MKPLLKNLLRCPECRSPLRTESFYDERDEIVSGLLHCSCGRRYPVVDAIPRMLPDASAMFPEFYDWYRASIAADLTQEHSRDSLNTPTVGLKKRTQETFGYQWNEFADMVEQNREFFLKNYSSVGREFFAGKVGLDAGCGFGRHLYYASEYGATMVGLDYSRAIDAAHRILREKNGVHLVQGDIYRPPFAPGSFDFVYSFGVLHHLPDPLRGFVSLRPLLKRNAPIFVWLYSKQRKFLNRIIEILRVMFKRLPLRLLKFIAFSFAVIDYSLIIFPYKVVSRIFPLTRWLPGLTEGRFSIYARLPFRVSYADWYDRLSPPLRSYYDEHDLETWVEASNLKNARIEATGKFGWKLYGEVS